MLRHQKCAEVISNSDIKLPAQQCQPLSLHHYHCMATHCHHQAPWPMPISGPTQGKLIDINNPMHHPTATSLQQHPCCLSQQPHGRQWQQGGRVEGEWGEWVERERETGKVMMMQCATHMLDLLFLSFYVVWWHGVQPTCCIIYFIPSMLFNDVACNPHTTLSIYFSLCCLMMQCATYMPCHLFISLHVVWWCSVQPTCWIIYFFPSMLFNDVVYNPHAMSSISFPPCCLMMQCATHMLCCLFLFVFISIHTLGFY